MTRKHRTPYNTEPQPGEYQGAASLSSCITCVLEEHRVTKRKLYGLFCVICYATLECEISAIKQQQCDMIILSSVCIVLLSVCSTINI